jgi:hypothetical protein
MQRIAGHPYALDIAAAAALFLIALAAYGSTLTPGLSYASPDGGEMATVPYRLGLLHPTGYPLYTWLAKLFTLIPAGDVAYRTNLLSAAGAAGSAAVLYALLLILTSSRAAALFAATLWAVSTTLWSQAVIAEVYAPNAFMLTLTLLLGVAWGQREKAFGRGFEVDRTGKLLFLGLCLTFGLSLGTHMSNLAFAPALALYVLLVNWRVLARPGLVVAGGLLLAVGLAQFLWLPVRASVVNDPLILRATPTTWESFYNYTLNAFSGLRWAFPLEALPDRFQLYLGFVRDNFGLGGLLLALAGAVELMRLRPREFLLLSVGYGIQLAFFLHYRVFDIEVFFIPAHLVLAICAGFGAWRLLRLVQWAGNRVSARSVRTAALTATTALLFLPLAPVYVSSREANDRSSDTLVNDFYNAVFEYLPGGSTLVGLTGVIGSDMFYFRLVENRRPDIVMPLIEDPRNTWVEPGADLYTTWRPQTGRQLPWAPPQRLFPPDAWFIPVLAAPSSPTGGLPFQRSLTLYRVSRAPPPEMVVTDAEPEVRLDAMLVDVRLVGYDLPNQTVTAGGLVRVRLYWAFTRAGSYSVTTRLGDSPFTETHWMTFANLPRYLRDVGAPQGRPWVSVEEYDLVVPSSQKPGEQRLTVTVVRHGPNGERTSASIEAGTITVVR